MANLTEFKCPSCGGSLNFDTEVQQMKCPYCDSEFDVEAVKKDEIEENQVESDSINWNVEKENWEGDDSENIAVYGCKSCGGEIIAESTTASTFCPFCDNPVVIAGKVAGSIKPNYIIPFKLDKNMAVEKFKSHLQNKKLLNKIFKSNHHIEEIRGVYVPFWLFDATAEGKMRYKGTKVRTTSDSDYTYTTTSHYSITREGSLGFNKIPVDASIKMDNALMDSLEPFDFDAAVDFQTAYLSGYLADKYDETEEDCQPRANTRISQSLDDKFRESITGYSSVRTTSSSVNIDNGKAVYALYPVWILNTKWQGETHTFAMNGQTGKFVGNLPVDKGLSRLYFMLYSAISFGLLYAVGYLFNF